MEASDRSNLTTPSPAASTQAANANGKRRYYVGNDRRSVPAPVRPADLGILALIFAVVALAWVMVESAFLLERQLFDTIDDDVLVELLSTAIAVLGAVVAFLAFVRWRVAGVTDPVWTGAGALFFGTIAVGLGHLVPTLAPATEQNALLEGVQPAAELVAIAALLIGGVAAAVDTRVTPRRIGGAALFLTAVLTFAIYGLPVSGEFLISSAGRLVFVAGWLVVTAAHLTSGVKRRNRNHFAIATAGATIVLAELARVLALGTSMETAATATFFHTIAFGILLAQGLRDFELTFCDQRSRLFDTEIEVEQVNAIRRAEYAAHEERVHDAKNALFAIEGAAQTLERYRDQLDPERRAQLTEAVSAEIGRLQKLIAQHREAEGNEAFSLAELLMPIATTEVARGLRIEIEVPGDLVAVGRAADTAEVIRNLLDNARRYAPGSPVAVRGERDGTWAVLYVEDRGRGIDRDERDVIFERGQRGDTAQGIEGSGLGLFVSRRLMLEQQGDLWVEDRPGGGARFGLCLPFDDAGTTAIGDLDVETTHDEQARVGGNQWQER